MLYTALMSTFNPTAEQEVIVDFARTGGSLVIEAGAGTGKTSTLGLIAEALAPKQGLYVAYNKGIKLDAERKFQGKNIECRTANSLAMATHGGKLSHRLNKTTPAWKAAKILNIRPFSYTEDGEDHTLTPRALAVQVSEAVKSFCNSADLKPSRRHIDKSIVPAEAVERYLSHLIPYLAMHWADVTSPSGQLTFMHDHYLKLWSLAMPVMRCKANGGRPYDFILFDEAQDANPAIAVVVEAQPGQQVMVGDRAQAIYGWRGAVDAMAKFKADGHFFLTQSFRFGPAVAEQANRLLEHVGTPLRLSGFEKLTSTVEPVADPKAILCRTNGGCIESAIQAMKNGQLVAIQGGTGEIGSFVRAAANLMIGKGTDNVTLAHFKDWDEVLQAVKDGEADDLRMLVRLIENYGTEAILEVCAATVDIAKADVIISTAHKAKGQEFDTVKIHFDFKPTEHEDGTYSLSITEAMLIYVAITRAKQTLDMGALAWLDEIQASVEAA